MPGKARTLLHAEHSHQDGGDARPSGSRAVLVPIRSFANAKERLAPVLDTGERAALVRAMAERVLDAAGALPVLVVCDDPVVAAWATRRGAAVMMQPGAGLNAAVAAGVARLARSGIETVTVSHADLPLASDLTAVGEPGVVTIVPDRSDDGSNVVSVPASSGFRFSYGRASFGRHVLEAKRLGLPVTVLAEPSLSFDVDFPDDLEGLRVIASPQDAGLRVPHAPGHQPAPPAIARRER